MRVMPWLVVRELGHVGRLDGLGEARPAAAGLELVRGRKQRLAGDDVHVDAGLLVVEQRARARSLGAVLLSDAELLRREPCDGIGRLLVSVMNVSFDACWPGWTCGRCGRQGHEVLGHEAFDVVRCRCGPGTLISMSLQAGAPVPEGCPRRRPGSGLSGRAGQRRAQRNVQRTLSLNSASSSMASPLVSA
jgi:hypothetical protein